MGARDFKRKVGHSLGPIRRGIVMAVAMGKMIDADAKQKANLKTFVKRLKKKDPPKFPFSESQHV